MEATLKRGYSRRFERNLLACWKRADPRHMDEGLTWYARANARAQGYAERFGVTTEQACGVIAALSPGRNWDVNLQDAETLMQAWNSGDRGRDLPNVGSYGRRNITKAAKILAGKHPLDVLGGLKVRAFYACLVDPANDSEVCIDRHAKSAAHGKRMREKQTTVRKGEFAHLVLHYRKVSAKVGVLPHQFQAVVWVVWRSLRGNLDQGDLFEGAYGQESSQAHC